MNSQVAINEKQEQPSHDLECSLLKVDPTDEEDPFFFDPSDAEYESVGNSVMLILDVDVVSAIQEVLDDAPGVENNYAKTTPTPEILRKLQPFLAYWPLDVIKKTLECTTRMASVQVQLPLCCHLKARFSFLNVKKLHEAISTNTYFVSVMDVSGLTCAKC